MLSETEITKTHAQMTAVIRFTIPRAEIVTVMGPAFAELGETLAAQGIAAIGPAFSHHFRIEPELFDFEVGFPVATPVTASGRVLPSQLPARDVARAIYRGPYAGLATAWAELDAWINAGGHTTAPGLVERYLVGPATESEPGNWQTELLHPIEV